MDHPKRRKTDRIEDHTVVWKYIASAIVGASTASMLLLVINLLYGGSPVGESNTAYLNMYEKYKEYSHSYANQLYDRVGNVTDVVTSYQRTTEYRLDQQQKMIEALQKQLAETKVVVNNTNNNMQNNKNNKNNSSECNGDNKNK